MATSTYYKKTFRDQNSTPEKDAYVFGGKEKYRPKKNNSKPFSFWSLVDACLTLSAEAMIGFKLRGDEKNAAKAEAILTELTLNLKKLSPQNAPAMGYYAGPRAIEVATEQTLALSSIVHVVKSFAETFESQCQPHRVAGPNNDAVEYVLEKYLNPDRPMSGLDLLRAKQEGGLSAAMADTLIQDTGHFAAHIGPAISARMVDSREISVAGYQNHLATSQGTFKSQLPHLGRLSGIGIAHLAWDYTANYITGALMNLNPVTASLAKMVPSLTAVAPHVMISMMAGLAIAGAVVAMAKPTPTTIETAQNWKTTQRHHSYYGSPRA